MGVKTEQRRFPFKWHTLRGLLTRQPLDLRLHRYRLHVLWSFLIRQPLDVRLRHEFNLWAQNERGERMERAHMRFTEKAFEKMNLSPSDRVLDLGCGEGWACRFVATRLGGGCRVVGLDISDEMLRRARAKSSQFQNLTFVCGSAEHLPWRDNFFTALLCVESFYYFEHQQQVLGELFRVLAPSGRLFFLLCLYKDHPESFAFVDELRVPVQLRSAAEYKVMLQTEGWEEAEVEELVLESQTGRKPDFHDRALSISARKPARARQMASLLSGPAQHASS